MQRRIQLVDVFASTQLSGNPLAVVLDSDGLSTEQMQRFTRWMHFSETTFVLPATTADADYKVRIFTLERELPFAGHPTLGSCHAWLRAGGKPRKAGWIVQECGIGQVLIRHDNENLAFAAPALLRDGPVEPAKLKEIAHALRISVNDIVEARWADNGPGWVAVLLSSAEAVLAIDPIPHSPTRLEIGVVGPYPPGGELACELRAFLTDQHGAVIEDPVTGSLNASVAQWMLSAGHHAAPYVASQGTRLGHAGRINISVGDHGEVFVGGKTTTVVDGQLNL